MSDQSVPFETDCLCIRLRRIARSVTQAYDDALAASGVKLTQFSLLRSVQRNEPAAIGVLAEELELDRTTLARNLRPLERDGLLTTSASSNDQRVTEVRLTARGRRTIAQALPAWQQAQADMSRRIGARHADLLYELACALPAALQAPPAPTRKARAR
ncbi:MAG: MarR family transcriptional regulator [Dokdonella sp.]